MGSEKVARVVELSMEGLPQFGILKVEWLSEVWCQPKFVSAGDPKDRRFKVAMVSCMEAASGREFKKFLNCEKNGEWSLR